MPTSCVERCTLTATREATMTALSERSRAPGQHCGYLGIRPSIP